MTSSIETLIAVDFCVRPKYYTIYYIITIESWLNRNHDLGLINLWYYIFTIWPSPTQSNCTEIVSVIFQSLWGLTLGPADGRQRPLLLWDADVYSFCETMKCTLLRDLLFVCDINIYIYMCKCTLCLFMSDIVPCLNCYNP